MGQLHTNRARLLTFFIICTRCVAWSCNINKQKDGAIGMGYGMQKIQKL